MNYRYDPTESLTELENRYESMRTQYPETCEHKHCADISGGWGTIRCFDCGQLWLR